MSRAPDLRGQAWVPSGVLPLRSLDLVANELYTHCIHSSGSPHGHISQIKTTEPPITAGIQLLL